MNVPIGFRSAHDLAAPQQSYAERAKVTQQGSTLSVLVVDDEAAVLEELTTTLSRRGLHVLSASSAELALGILCSRPDIGALISDIRMPGMDGIALAERAIAGRTESEAIEVVLVTGYASAAQGMAASRLGAFGVLQKPMRGADLARMAQEALRRATLRRGASPMTRAEDGWPPARPLAFARRAEDREAGMRQQTQSEAVEALLATTMLAGGKDATTLHAPLAALIGGDPGAMPPPRMLALMEDLSDLAALEQGLVRAKLTPVSPHGLVGAIAARLTVMGARCPRRITLHPDADPVFDLDTGRLVRAVALVAGAVLAGRTGLAEVALDASASQVRLDLDIRPDTADAPDGAPPSVEAATALATRLVAALGGRLEAHPTPGGGLHAQLVLRAS